MTQHTHITQRDKAICDFCSGPDVTRRYPCTATVAMLAGPAGGPPRLVAESNDDWSSCETCGRLIDAGDPVALAESVLSRPADPEVAIAMALVPELRITAMDYMVGLYTRLLPLLGKPEKDTTDLRPGEGRLIRIDDDGE